MPVVALERRTQFLHDYGALLSVWSEFELAIEVKIAQLAGLDPLKASIILGGLSFGNKPAILSALLNESGDTTLAPKVQAVINAAKRNSLVHGIVASDDMMEEIGFVKREIGPGYSVKKYPFNEATFHKHFLEFRRLYGLAIEAMGLTLDDLEEYGRKAQLFPAE